MCVVLCLRRAHDHTPFMNSKTATRGMRCGCTGLGGKGSGHTGRHARTLGGMLGARLLRREAADGGEAHEAHVVAAAAHRVVEELVCESVVLREELSAAHGGH